MNYFAKIMKTIMQYVGQMYLQKNDKMAKRKNVLLINCRHVTNYTYS